MMAARGMEGENLRDAQLEHIGVLMAGLSHDFKNHLAIINELQGLLADILGYDRKSGLARHDRYASILASIHDRVLAAAEACHYLSRFSHRMDQRLSSFQINDVLAEELYLLRRVANGFSVTLAAEYGEGLPAVWNDPALLQCVCYYLLRSLLKLAEKKSTITVRTLGDDLGAMTVTLTLSKARHQDIDAAWSNLLTILAIPLSRLGASLSRNIAECLCCPEYLLTIPLPPIPASGDEG